jgi:hypothetical protein
MARRAHGTNIRYVTYDEYAANARRWKVMGSTITPTEEAKAAGAFAVIMVGGRKTWLVYTG